MMFGNCMVNIYAGVDFGTQITRFARKAFFQKLVQLTSYIITQVRHLHGRVQCLRMKMRIGMQNHIELFAVEILVVGSSLQMEWNP